TRPARRTSAPSRGSPGPWTDGNAASSLPFRTDRSPRAPSGGSSRAAHISDPTPVENKNHSYFYALSWTSLSVARAHRRTIESDAAIVGRRLSVRTTRVPQSRAGGYGGTFEV